MIKSISSFMSKYFILIALAVGVVGYLAPPVFSWASPYITPLLGITMFAMGLTTEASDFKNIFLSPKTLIIGVVGVFAVAPVVTFIICKALVVPTEIFIGVMLCACCPGGTTSNVFTMLAKGDTPLSIGMTFIETLLASIVTPALVLFFCGQATEVDAMGMMMSVIKIVIIPVVLGLLFKTKFRSTTEKLMDGVPMISIACVILILGGVVGRNGSLLFTAGSDAFITGIIFIPVCLVAGYFAARALKINIYQSKAIAIEVGFKNSNLAIALATAHFANMPLATLPCIIIVIMTNILGPVAASIGCRMNDAPEAQTSSNNTAAS